MSGIMLFTLFSLFVAVLALAVTWPAGGWAWSLRDPVRFRQQSPASWFRTPRPDEVPAGTPIACPKCGNPDVAGDQIIDTAATDAAHPGGVVVAQMARLCPACGYTSADFYTPSLTAARSPATPSA